MNGRDYWPDKTDAGELRENSYSHAYFRANNVKRAIRPTRIFGRIT